MKLLVIFFILYCTNQATLDKLKKLDAYLYQVEDKIDHLLYHHGHDVTKHSA